HLQIPSNPLTISPRRRLALLSNDVHILILVDLSLPENGDFRPATLTQEVDPDTVSVGIDHAFEAAPHFAELFGMIKFHLEDAVLYAVTEAFKNLCDFGPALVIRNVVRNQVEHTAFTYYHSARNGA